MDHFQFILLSGPNIPGSYVILFFTALDFTSITSHIHNWVLFLLWLSFFILSGVILHSSSVAYWAPTNLGSLCFISFCLFILFMGFSRRECQSGFPFPSPVDHVLSELCTMTPPSWTLHSIFHSFIELEKTVIHVISLFSFLFLWFSFCMPSDG